MDDSDFKYPFHLQVAVDITAGHSPFEEIVLGNESFNMVSADYLADELKCTRIIEPDMECRYSCMKEDSARTFCFLDADIASTAEEFFDLLPQIKMRCARMKEFLLVCKKYQVLHRNDIAKAMVATIIGTEVIVFASNSQGDVTQWSLYTLDIPYFFESSNSRYLTMVSLREEEKNRSLLKSLH